jgi:hypothetical protein
MTDTLTDGHLLNALDQIRNLKSERATLRDQFAMSALTGMIPSISSSNWTKIAEHSYEVADAMLAAREKKND